KAESSFSTESAMRKGRVSFAARMLVKPSASPPGPANRSTTANSVKTPPFSRPAGENHNCTISNRTPGKLGKTVVADIVDRKTRSRMMSGIRGKNTKPELALRRALHSLGLRYRVHASGLPGRPDIVFPRYHAVVQIQGCFWHRHEGCS